MFNGYAVFNNEGKWLARDKIWKNGDISKGAWVWSPEEVTEIITESKNWAIQPASLRPARYDLALDETVLSHEVIPVG